MVTVDLSEEPSPGLSYVRYYITPDLCLDVTGNDITKVLTVKDPNTGTVDPDSRIKNVYYRYKIWAKY